MKKLFQTLGRLLPLVLVAGVTAWLFFFPHGGTEPPAKAKDKGPTSVTTVTVARGDLTETYQTVGAAAGASEVKITAHFEGVLQEVSARAGAMVKKGETLAVLDERLLDAERAQAEAALQRSNEELDRARQLATTGLADRKRVEMAIAQQRTDQAATQRVQAQMAASRFPSPLDGLVTADFVEPGDAVRSGLHLFTVTDVARLIVAVKVPEEIAARLQPGAAARLQVVARGGEELPARVAQIFPGSDPVSHQTTVELDAGEAFPRLQPGYMVKIQLTLATREKVLTLDRRVFPELPADGKAKAFVVKGADRVELRKVQLGLAVEDKVEVLQGLEEGERVVLRGGEKLKDGAAVQIADPPPSSLATP